ncbi:LppX_LprAFG lipoprotein [Nocardioides donggukensis]|uniref:LppX_LprAFG lipoprotein n=1 Tax=Nocardioides donggukensis TaxID=2774019 RepID=A0A927K5R2_9ACTN|nr:LppX_LprAFG lipoprotein [Nocardioides donggukensis]MBD8869645.1 LppX_LprAFG lipoprotein [Nocardioides donggukensis]
MRIRLLPAALLALALTTAGCTGSDGATSEQEDPQEAMELAKTTLDETSGVQLRLSTADLPNSVQGVSSAEGVGIHPPAFEGTITASISGVTADVDVVATDGKVWIKFLSPTFQEADPADYGAPDPAVLMATEGGFSDLLVSTEDLAKGEEVRGGTNNEEILTEYTGTLPAELVSVVIPSATGDFDATYTITSEGELRQAVLTGEFYPGAGDVTYTLDVDDYGTEQEISAP